jgi:hypothetical protein
MAKLFASYNLTPQAHSDGAAGALQMDDEGRLKIGGALKLLSAGFTRPADTTAYAAGDAVNNSTTAPVPMTFAGAANQTGRGGVIEGARIFKSGDTITNATFRLHLYNSTITPANDNAALALLYADLAKYLGYIDFSTMVDVGNHGVTPPSLLVPARFPYICAATSVFGIMAALAAYTPASAETFVAHLIVRPD